MSDEENEDLFPDGTVCVPPSGLDMEVMEQIMRDKKGEPSKYASYWEMDELDIEEATDEEIQGNPKLRLLWAAENGKLDIVEELLSDAADVVNIVDKDGYTPLHRAAYNDHVDVATYLLDHGANIESRTSDGWTPLHSACNWGNHKMSALLLTRGADINAQTNGQQTALHLAATNSQSRETIELLLMNPHVDFSLKNSLGETAKTLGERYCKYHFLFEIADDSVNKMSS